VSRKTLFSLAIENKRNQGFIRAFSAAVIVLHILY